MFLMTLTNFILLQDVTLGMDIYLKGGRCSYVDYFSLPKAKDTDILAMTKFERKIASGAPQITCSYLWWQLCTSDHFGGEFLDHAMTLQINDKTHCRLLLEEYSQGFRECVETDVDVLHAYWVVRQPHAHTCIYLYSVHLPHRVGDPG